MEWKENKDGGYTLELNKKPDEKKLNSTPPKDSNDPANLAAQGQVALSNQEYTKAVELYTRALAGSPTSVDYYIKRSTANQRAANHTDALNDAEIAVNLADKRGKRELIGQAQLRRAISLFMLERYGDSGRCFSWSLEKNPAEKSVPFWQKKLEMELAKCDEDDVRREVTVLEVPNVNIPKPVAPVTKKADEKVQTEVVGNKIQAVEEEEVKVDKGKGRADGNTAAKEEKKEEPKGVITPASKIRHEWYQTAANVVVSLFVKGAPKDQTQVDINERSLSITFPLPTGADFTFDLDPLCHTIDVSKSSHRVLSTKIEITLSKTEQGRKWATLESTTEPAEEPTKTSSAPAPEPAARPPAYPTSAKGGPKNWDKVVNDLAAASKAKKKDGEKKEGEAEDIDYADIDDDEFGNDPVNSFFKKLYKDADPDTRRAMMKSYTESNGTALSTNWSEVGKGKVETSPPEGMEAKQWGV